MLSWLARNRMEHTNWFLVSSITSSHNSTVSLLASRHICLLTFNWNFILFLYICAQLKIQTQQQKKSIPIETSGTPASTSVPESGLPGSLSWSSAGATWEHCLHTIRFLLMVQTRENSWLLTTGSPGVPQLVSYNWWPLLNSHLKLSHLCCVEVLVELWYQIPVWEKIVHQKNGRRTTSIQRSRVDQEELRKNFKNIVNVQR